MVQYLKTGQKILVLGSTQYWSGLDTQKEVTKHTRIVATDIRFLTPKRTEEVNMGIRGNHQDYEQTPTHPQPHKLIRPIPNDYTEQLTSILSPDINVNDLPQPYTDEYDPISYKGN
jgi:single-stranded DNA-binding protein